MTSQPQNAQTRQKFATGDVPIAIVGMACIFPQAQSPANFWSNILEGRDAIREVPMTHWRASDYFNSDPKSPDMTYSHSGAFLDPIDFAPLDFGIAPKNLEAIDTTQLLGLVVARDALSDSGYGTGGKDFNRHRASVILGVTGTLEMVIPLGARLGHPIWRKSLADCGVDPDTAEKVVDRIGEHYNAWQENSFPGLLGNVTAGRIANRLDLGGTNCVVDAACASSLGAVHLAQMELATGRADMVVTGGFDTFNDIFMFMCFSKTPALSKSGHARPFDQSADGTSLGEGLGAVVMKRLSDAERDGDRIYAVIRGVGTSSDGIGQAVYAPKAEGQVRCLKAAYEAAGVDPATVELVEAHGTGTKVGDGIEVKALAEVYRASSTAENGRWCGVGSVKSQIGHTKAAAGVAGLIKAALALHHKVIPPTIKVDTPADEITAEDAPFYVPTQPRPWPARTDHPRRAGVSAFGFGGSNFHAVLEEYAPNTNVIGWSDDVDVWPVSADSLDHLRQAVDAVPESATWKTLQRAAAKGRSESASAAANWKLAVVLKKSQDWSRQRQSILNGLNQAGSASNQAVNSPDGWFLKSGPATGKLALLFTGQGAQSVGMLRDAACRLPLVARTLDESDQSAGRPAGFLASKIYPVHLLTEQSRTDAEAQLTRTEIAQPALAALGLGIARVLGDFGVAPHGLAGHSLGELTALSACGKIAPKQVHRLVDIRGNAMSRAARAANSQYGKGGMLAVLAEEPKWADLLQNAKFSGRVTVANRNAPAQTVLAGSEQSLVEFAKDLTGRGVRSKLLQVDSAFHSPWVEPASQELLEELAATTWRQSSLAVYQNTTAEVYPNDPAQAAQLLAHQLARPVDFVKMIRKMESDGYTTFVEIGPDARLTNLVRQSLVRPESAEVFAFSETPGAMPAKAMIDLASTLARLWVNGQSIQWTKWEPEQSVQRIKPEKKSLTVVLTGANLRPTPAPMQPPVKPVAKPLESVQIQQPAEKSEPTHLASRAELPKIAKSPESPAVTQPQVSPVEPAGMSGGLKKALTGSNELKELAQMKPLEKTDVAPTVTAGHALTALQKLMEQNAAVHSQFLATQKHAQETLRLLLGISPGHASAVEPAQTNGIHKSHAVNGQMPKFDPAPAAFEEFAKPSLVADQPTGIPIPQPSMVFTAPAPLNMEEEDPGLDVFSPPPVFAPVAAAPAPAPVHVAPVVAAQAVPVSAPAPTPAPASDGSSPLAKLLLEIVSEKTGYPLEMLDLDQHLDADLGIDSIKRVEILSAIQEQRSDLPHVRTDQFGALRRLRDVVELLDATAPAAPAAAIAPESPTVTSAPAPQPAAAAPVAAASAAVSEKLTQIVREVISEKTGYPVEMLELSMQLDTDLGIDSIKRVEILSGIQERLPHIPHIRTDQFGSLLTIGDIIQALSEIDNPPPDGSGGSGSRGPAASAPSGMAVRDVSTSSVKTSRLAVGSIAGNAPRSRYAPEQGAQVLILGDESELLTGIAESFAAIGVETRRVAPEDVDSVEPPDRLLGLILTTPTNYNHAAFGRVLRLVQKTSASLQKNAGDRFSFVAGLTLLDGSFGLDPDVESEDLSGWPTASLSGLVKTLAWEWPSVAARVLDVDPRWADWQPGDAGAKIVEELLTDGPVERGISDREPVQTVTTVLEPVNRNGSADIRALQQKIQPGDVIVVTGGARGVTAEVAAAFAEAVAPTLVLLGRSAEPGPEAAELAGCATESAIVSVLARQQTVKRTPPQLIAEAKRVLADREVRHNLDRFRRLGAKVVYRSVDLQSGQAVSQALQEVAGQIGPVRGIVHGAGVLADKRVEDLTADASAPVLETKVRGLLNVLGGVNANDLRFVCLFSSITARVGRTGQAAYAAANEMLNKLAIHKSRLYPQCRWLSLGWGPWDGGMVTPALKKVFASEGVGLIPLEGGSWSLLELVGGQPANGQGVEILVLEGEGRPLTPSVQVPGLSANDSGSAKNSAARTANPRLIWEKKACLSEWPVLRDHVINGSPVVPTALLTEWMIESAMHVLPGLELDRVQSMKVLKGVVLNADSAESLQVWLDNIELGEHGRAIADVVIRGIHAQTGRKLDHARAQVLLTPTGRPIQKPAWLGHQPEQVWAEPYRGLLFHGKAFQVLDGSVAYDNKTFVGRLKSGSHPADWLKSPSRSQWIVDPLILDGIMQGLCGWPKMTGGHFSLPMGFDSLEWLKASPEDYRGGGIALNLTRLNDHEIKADAVVWNAQGILIGRLDGIRGIMDANLAGAFLRNSTTQATGC